MSIFTLRKRTDPECRCGCHIVMTIPAPVGFDPVTKSFSESEYVETRAWACPGIERPSSGKPYNVFDYLDIWNCQDHIEYALSGNPDGDYSGRDLPSHLQVVNREHIVYATDALTGQEYTRSIMTLAGKPRETLSPANPVPQRDRKFRKLANSVCR